MRGRQHLEKTPPTDEGLRGCVLRAGVGHVELSISGMEYAGILRELSPSHMGVFVRPPLVGGSSTSEALARIFTRGKELTASIEIRGRRLKPCRACVRACYESWVRGYKVLVVADFVGLGAEDEETLRALIIEERRRTAGSVRPPTMKPRVPPAAVSGGEAVQVTFPAKRAHSAIFRCICEGLAAQAGFSPRDVFHIKLAADEVFTNAVIHGSERYGVSRVHADIILDEDGMTVQVRDEGGLPFDPDAHRTGPEGGGRRLVRSGLDIVDRVMDSWTVHTEQGRFTEVMFCKKRVPRG